MRRSANKVRRLVIVSGAFMHVLRMGRMTAGLSPSLLLTPPRAGSRPKLAVTSPSSTAIVPGRPPFLVILVTPADSIQRDWVDSVLYTRTKSTQPPNSPTREGGRS